MRQRQPQGQSNAEDERTYRVTILRHHWAALAIMLNRAAVTIIGTHRTRPSGQHRPGWPAPGTTRPSECSTMTTATLCSTVAVLDRNTTESNMASFRYSPPFTSDESPPASPDFVRPHNS